MVAREYASPRSPRVLGISCIGGDLLLPLRKAAPDRLPGDVDLLQVVSENRWEQFPDNVKKARLEAGADASRSACAGMDKEEASDFEKLQQSGVTPVRWSGPNKRELDAVLVSVANEWATDLDKRGKPGSQVLKAVLEARGGR